MYEQYLREPSSVGEEWRKLFDNGRLAELPVIPANREAVLREEGSGKGEESRVPAPTLPSSPIPLPPGLTPLTRPAARLAPHMADPLSVPTPTPLRAITG